jgi:hypothetical protein
MIERPGIEADLSVGRDFKNSRKQDSSLLDSDRLSLSAFADILACGQPIRRNCGKANATFIKGSGFPRETRKSKSGKAWPMKYRISEFRYESQFLSSQHKAGI